MSTPIASSTIRTLAKIGVGVCAILFIIGSGGGSSILNVPLGYVFFSCLAVSLGLWVWAEEKEKRESLMLSASAAELRKKAEYDATQYQVWSHLQACISDVESTALEIRRKIEAAEVALSHAEREFSEGVFAPFWDAVEHAANQLAQSDAGINRIIQQSKYYRDNVTKLNSEGPPFRIGLDALPDTTRTADKMRLMVRKAQKDFHFATIYEQRKTNKLLIAGFTNLAEALNGMSDRLASSIDALSDSLHDIADTNRANTEELLASILKLDERMASDSLAQRDHEGKQREMLDNIQRGRKPRRVYPKTFE